MSYNQTAYDTTAGKIFPLKHVDLALREALITGDLASYTLGVKSPNETQVIFVLGNGEKEKAIPPFVHPYLIQNFKGQNFLVSDLRDFRPTRDEWLSQAEFDKGVRNKTEYSLVKTRAAMNALWLDDVSRAKMRAEFGFAGNVYAAALSQSISKAYVLDFQDQAYLYALSLYYYYTLFVPAGKLDDELMDILVRKAADATKLTAKTVYDIFDKITEMKDISDYCENVKNVIQSVRLKDFNLGVLLTLVRNIWYGNHAKDMVAAALEHPPTWISIVYATMTERSYKASQLYKTVEMLAKRGNGETFQKNFVEVLRTQVLAIESIDEPIQFKAFED